jgi:hypothetical protein
VCEDFYERKHWVNIFDRVFLEGKPDSWAYIWLFTCWSQSGLIAVSNPNLIINIGFGSDATHTKGSSQLTHVSTEELREIHHPPFLIQDKETDQWRFDYLHGGKAKKEADTFLGKFRSYASKIKHRIIRLLTDSLGVSRSLYQKLMH